MTQEPTPADRLISLWDHLGLKSAHVAAQMPVDIASLVRACPDRIAGLLFCAPIGIDPIPLAAIASRVVLVAGDRGISRKLPTTPDSAFLVPAASPWSIMTPLPGPIASPTGRTPLSRLCAACLAMPRSRNCNLAAVSMAASPTRSTAPALLWCCFR